MQLTHVCSSGSLQLYTRLGRILFWLSTTNILINFFFPRMLC